VVKPIWSYPPLVLPYAPPPFSGRPAIAHGMVYGAASPLRLT